MAVGTRIKARSLGAATADGNTLANAGACVVNKLILSVAATARWIKFYDKATAPANTDTPILSVFVAAGASPVLDFGMDGIPCALGFGWRMSVNGIDNDATYTAFAAADSSVTAMLMQMA